MHNPNKYNSTSWRSLFGVFFLLHISIGSTYGQEEIKFIQAYNEHIDPNNKLNSLQFLTIKKKTIINYIQGNDVRIMQQTQTCFFTNDGFERCIENNTGSSMDMSSVPIPNEIGNKDFIKNELNFILIGLNSNQFCFITRNDSITVIEQVRDKLSRSLFTFHSQTKNLLQIKSFQGSSDEKNTRHTDFLSYTIVNDIVIPTKMTYSNSFCNALLEYSDISFEPFTKSIIKKH